MTAPRQHLVGALFIDCGEGHEIRTGDRAGQIVYKRQPRAKYECLRCQTVEGPVTGATAVTAFVATIRAQHHQTHHINQQGAHPA